jgi:hypothetical protein
MLSEHTYCSVLEAAGHNATSDRVGNILDNLAAVQKPEDWSSDPGPGAFPSRQLAAKPDSLAQSRNRAPALRVLGKRLEQHSSNLQCRYASGLVIAVTGKKMVGR